MERSKQFFQTSSTHHSSSLGRVSEGLGRGQERPWGRKQKGDSSKIWTFLHPIQVEASLAELTYQLLRDSKKLDTLESRFYTI